MGEATLLDGLDERIDQLVPVGDEPWQFNREVTDVFENMLARSIPQLGTMRSLAFNLGATLVQPGTTIMISGAQRVMPWPRSSDGSGQPTATSAPS